MTQIDHENPFIKQRRSVHSAVEGSLGALFDETPHRGHIISGWVLIYETVGPNGERGFHSASGDATGETDLPPWTAEGWTRYAAASGYFDGAEEEDDDDD